MSAISEATDQSGYLILVPWDLANGSGMVFLMLQSSLDATTAPDRRQDDILPVNPAP